jgi:hypothetical protein
LFSNIDHEKSKVGTDLVKIAKKGSRNEISRRSLNLENKIEFLDQSTLTTTTVSSSEEEGIEVITRKRKGKHAYATENRRFVWEYIVWPLILQVDRQYFTLQEYRTKRDEFSIIHNIQQQPPSRLSGGLISLVDKGILAKNKEGLYSIDFRLIPYMRKKIKLEYGLAVKEIYTK